MVKLDKPIQDGEDNVTHVSLMPTVIREPCQTKHEYVLFFIYILNYCYFTRNKLVLFLCKKP